MGIENLWGIVPSDERVSFPVFLSRFLQNHGRPPRFAIDAYMFMFWSSVSNADESDPVKETYDIRNFMAKLWYLVQVNVSFVVVFDGAHKPRKLRNGHIPQTVGSESYDEQLEHFLKLHRSKFSECSRLVENLKSILSRNRIDWEQAPGEAEAECAWVQRLGVVDYVISDDSDTLVFGATKVLRWFTRVKYYTEDKEPVNSATDYYVTPAHMETIVQQTNLTRNHFVFIAVLRGGDYSSGAESIGITRAKELALCGTNMLQKKARATAQDFGMFEDLTKMFVNTFVLSERSEISPDPYYGRKDVNDRHLSLKALNNHLNRFLKEKASQVFGRTTKFDKVIEIEDYHAMLYFFPLVNTKIFKFTPHSTSFAESSPLIKDLTGVQMDCEVSRYNNQIAPGVIGKSRVVSGVHSFEQYLNLNVSKTALPRERKYSLKAFVVKFLRDESFWRLIQFARLKDFEGVTLAILKFNRVKLNEFVYLKRKDFKLDLDPEEDQNTHLSQPSKEPPSLQASDAEEEGEKEDDKLSSLIVPLESVKFVSTKFVNKFKHQAQRRSPKKKKSPPQRTTLDSLLESGSSMFRQSARKESHVASSVKILLNESSQLSNVAVEDEILRQNADDDPAGITRTSPEHARAYLKKSMLNKRTHDKKSSSRRKNNSPQLSPGQSTLASFIQLTRRGRSEDEPLFISSGEEDNEKDDYYQKMKDSFGFGPILLEPKCSISVSHCGSQDSSPTKRHKKEMDFSPENSPIQMRSETTEPW